MEKAVLTPNEIPTQVFFDNWPSLSVDPVNTVERTTGQNLYTTDILDQESLTYLNNLHTYTNVMLNLAILNQADMLRAGPYHSASAKKPPQFLVDSLPKKHKSGEQLDKLLKITRSALIDHSLELKRKGFDIEQINNDLLKKLNFRESKKQTKPTELEKLTGLFYKALSIQGGNTEKSQQEFIKHVWVYISGKLGELSTKSGGGLSYEELGEKEREKILEALRQKSIVKVEKISKQNEKQYKKTFEKYLHKDNISDRLTANFHSKELFPEIDDVDKRIGVYESAMLTAEVLEFSNFLFKYDPKNKFLSHIERYFDIGSTETKTFKPQKRIENVISHIWKLPEQERIAKLELISTQITLSIYAFLQDTKKGKSEQAKVSREIAGKAGINSPLTESGYTEFKALEELSDKSDNYYLINKAYETLLESINQKRHKYNLSDPSPTKENILDNLNFLENRVRSISKEGLIPRVIL